MPHPTFERLESRTLLSNTSIERVSVDSNGIPGDAHSDTSVISADGRYVAFLSTADNVVAGDSPGHLSVFLRDRQLGTTVRVSLATDGSEPDGNCFDPSISDNGRYIAYSSNADNLVANDINARSDVFVYDTQTHTTRRVSVAADGTQGDFGSFSPAISGDGTLITFLSDADNLVAGDTNNKSDVFVFNTQSNSPQRVSVDSQGNEGNAASYTPQISGNGRFVAFLSDATDLVQNDTNDAADVFVFDRQNSTTTRISVSSSGTQANNSSGRIAINADGRYVAFESDASNLVPGDSNGKTDVFVVDTQASTIRRISVASDGSQGAGNSTSPAISDNGEFIAFTSDAANLVAGDTNASTDIFLFDTQGATTKRVSTGPNDAQGNDDSDFASISGDGRYTGFFSNATNLVALDTNGVGDVFLKDRLAAPHAEVSGGPDGAPLVVIPTADANPLDVDGTNFGTVDKSGTGLVRTFTIRNSGVDTLTLSGAIVVKIDNVNSSDFTITQQPDKTSLLPDETTTFQITFSPTAVAIRTARVTFASNDTAAPLYTFRISGIGIDASNTTRLAVVQGATSIAVGTGSLSFGSTLLNSAAPVLTFTVTNTSGDTILFDPLTLTQNSRFEIASPLGATTLTPAATTTFSLRMLTASAGNASAVVTLTNTSSDIQSFTFNVTGAVTTPHATFIVDGGGVPAAVAFGQALKSQGGITKTFTVRNDGTAPLTFGTPSVPAGFTLTASTLKTLAPGQSATFTVRLDAAALGAKSGAISLSTNDPAAPVLTTTASGSVVSAIMAITLDGVSVASRPTTDFGAVTQGQAATTKTFSIVNLGTATLTLGAITLPSGFILSGSPDASVAPGASTNFSVTFDSGTVANLSGSLTLPTNDLANDPFTLPLTARVVPIVIVARATLLVDGAPSGSAAFASAIQGAGSASRTFTIRNDGNGPLTLGAPRLPAGFVLLAGPASTVQPGDSTSFTVSLPTNLAGNFAGSLTITTNDPSANPLSVALSGAVTVAPHTGISVDSITLASKPPTPILGGTPAATNSASVVITNNTSAAVSGTYKVTVYAAAGLTPNSATDKVLGTLSAKLTLKAHAGTTVKIKLTFPAPSVDGTFNVLAALAGSNVDPVYGVGKGASSIRLERPLARIGASSQPASAPATYAFGAKINTTAPIADQGNLAVKGKASVDVFLSRDGTTAAKSAFKLTTLPAVALNIAPGGVQKLPLKLTLPKKFPAGFGAGTYTLLVRVSKVTVPVKFELVNGGLITVGTVTIS